MTFRALSAFLLTALISPFAVAAEESSGFTSMEKAVFEVINKARTQHGKAPLIWNEKIQLACRQHSRQTAQGKRPLGHDDFDERLKNLAISFQSAGENVASNRGHDDPVAHAVKGWLKSPGHRANLLGDFTLTGVGIARDKEGRFYFTQIFLKTTPPL
ncbi:MAG: CAP domain-containing protein [Verrucomicrobiae bacterium]|nr:CAP domain-containing protein [Verrucomicrobiae bacterium]